MKKAVIIGIVVVIAIAIFVTMSSYDFAQNESVEIEDSSESKPRQFSVELSEGIGISDKQP